MSFLYLIYIYILVVNSQDPCTPLNSFTQTVSNDNCQCGNQVCSLGDYCISSYNNGEGYCASQQGICFILFKKNLQQLSNF